MKKYYEFVDLVKKHKDDVVLEAPRNEIEKKKRENTLSRFHKEWTDILDDKKRLQADFAKRLGYDDSPEGIDNAMKVYDGFKNKD